jgi:hypothetical protein
VPDPQGFLTRVVYQGWEGGDWGHLGAYEAGRRKAEGGQMFQALNMIRYRDGLLGPRPGLRRQPAAGMPVGVPTALGFYGTPGRSLFIGVGDDLYTLEPLDLSGVTHVGTFDATPTRTFVTDGDSGRSIISSYMEGLYELDLNPDPGVLGAPAMGAPAGKTATIHDARLFVAGVEPDYNRVYYSEPFDLYDFPALNYFDVGFTPQVRGLYPQRGHLLIIKQDYTAWALTGTPGTSSARLDRLRAGGGAPWHYWPSKGTLTEDEVLWLIGGSHDEPCMFDGTSYERERHLNGWLAGGVNPNAEGGIHVLPLGREDEVLMVNTDPFSDYQGRALVRVNGVWTRHFFTPNIAHYGASDRQGLVHLADDGGGGVAAPAIFTWNSELERPGRTDDQLADPGDDDADPLDAWLELPEWWAEAENECKVRGVIVDFVKYDTGASESNHFEVQVTTLRKYGTPEQAGGEDAVAFQAWDEDTDEAATAGTPDERHFGFNPPKGRGFRIGIAAVRGVAIRSVTAVVQVWERRIG